MQRFLEGAVFVTAAVLYFAVVWTVASRYADRVLDWVLDVAFRVIDWWEAPRGEK